MPSVVQVDRLGLAHRISDRCVVCGAEFYRTVEHVYKHRKHDRCLYECSWTCFRAMERKIEASGGKSKIQLEEPEEEKKAVDRKAQIEEKIAFYWAREKEARTTLQRKYARESVRRWMDKLKRLDDMREKK